MTKPLVSIITPCYNAGEFISETIKSVLNQTYKNWEMIIVDDGSTDGSENVIESFKDHRIKLIKSSWNGGAAVARNNAIAVSEGRLISFLDSDDTWHPEKLEKQVEFMVCNNVALSYTSYDRHDEEGVFLNTFRPALRLSKEDILKTNSIGCLTAMYDTEILGKVYMPNISKRQDLGLWIRILSKIDYAYGMPEVLAKYTVRKSGSVSSSKVQAAKFQWRLYREVENLGFKESLYYFCNYFYYGIKKS